MNLAGDAHVLCSPQIIGKYLSQCTTTEINAEKYIFKAMCFILRADKSRHRDMLEELRKGVYTVRGEYPTTVPDAYELLMRTSRQIRYEQRRPGRSCYRAQDSGIGEGFMFAQHGGHGGRGVNGNDTYHSVVPGRNEILHEKVRCYSC